MAESRVFRKAEGITIEGIGRSVQNFLRSSKGLVVQGGKAGEGYVVQAKEADSWKKVAGMSSAIEVQISDTGSGILVNIGNGQWSDKVGAGVLRCLQEMLSAQAAVSRSPVNVRPVTRI